MDEIRSTISPEMKLQMDMSVAIANRIYEILEAKGMSQKDLAHRLGKIASVTSSSNLIRAVSFVIDEPDKGDYHFHILPANQ